MYCEFSAIQFGNKSALLVGRITLEKEKLNGTWTKDSNKEGNKRTIQGILKQLSYNEDYESIDPKEDPGAWLKSLPFKYSGGVLWATLKED